MDIPINLRNPAQFFAAAGLASTIWGAVSIRS